MTYILIIGLLISLIPLSILARPSNRIDGLYLAKRLTIPMGLAATIVHLVQILSFLSESSELLLPIANALFPCLVACIQYTILNQIDAPSTPTNIVRRTAQISTLGLLAVILTYVVYLESFLFIVDFKTLCTFGIGIGLLGQIQRRFSSVESIEFGPISIQVALINAFYRSIQLIIGWPDPSTIGPNIASIYIGFLLGFTTLMVWEIQQPSVHSQSMPKQIVSSGIIMGTYILCFAPLWMLSLSFQLSNLEVQSNQVSQNVTTQQALLQKVVLYNAEAKSTHLTVSSDKPSWIFINDKLIGASPIYREQLEPGDYTIKIASCPTHILMTPENNILWDEYWMSASDGTCITPSEQENQELISRGLAKEIVIDTVDNLTMMSIEYVPELNFCCDENLTKTFQVTMTNEPQTHAWSFVEQDWIHQTTLIESSD